MTQFHQEGQRVSGTQYNVGGDMGLETVGRYYCLETIHKTQAIIFGEHLKHDGYLEAQIVFYAHETKLEAPMRSWPMLLRNRFILSGYNSESTVDDVIKRLEEQGFKKEG